MITMPDTTTGGVSTQVAHPGRATVRTVVQLVLPLLLVLGPTLKYVWDVIQEEATKQGLVIPDVVALYVGLAIAVCVVLSAVLTRVMANPVINKLLAKLGLSALPPAAEPEDPAPLAVAAREADGYMAQHAEETSD